MDGTLQNVVEVARELGVDEPEAVQYAQGLANAPQKDVQWYRRCADYLKMRRREETEVENKLGPIQQANWKAYKMVRDLVGSLIKPRERCREIVSKAMCEWKRDDDARLRAEEKRLADQAEASGEFIPPVFLQGVNVDGINHKKIWRVRVVNKRDLVHAVEKDPALMDGLKVDQEWFGRYATEHDGNINVGGLEVYPDDEIKVKKSA